MPVSIVCANNGEIARSDKRICEWTQAKGFSVILEPRRVVFLENIPALGRCQRNPARQRAGIEERWRARVTNLDPTLAEFVKVTDWQKHSILHNGRS